MMEAVGSSETAVTLSKATRRHIRDDININTVTATATNLAQFYFNRKMYKVLDLCLLCTGTQELKIFSLLVHQVHVYRKWEERRL
jgi:hypothetical protein